MALLDTQLALLEALTEGNTASGASPKPAAIFDTESKGMQVTREIIQWWRQARLVKSLPLTCRLLQRIQRQSVLEQYCHNTQCSTLYFVGEAEQFIHYLGTLPHREGYDPRLLPLARFEQSMHVAAEECLLTTDANQPFSRNDRYQYDIKKNICHEKILFPCNPPELFTALIRNEPLPPLQSLPCRVVVDSELPHYWTLDT